MKILSESICTRKGKDVCWIIGHSAIRLYVKRETAQNKSYKVPKLLLSEIKVIIIKYNQEIGLEAAIFWRPRNRALIYNKIL